MTFTYTRQTKGYFNPVRMDYEYDEYDFNFEPDEKELKEALISIVTNHYFGGIIEKNPELEEELTNKVKNLIEAEDLEQDLAEAFKDDLKEYFEDDALASEGDR